MASISPAERTFYVKNKIRLGKIFSYFLSSRDLACIQGQADKRRINNWKFVKVLMTSCEILF